MSLADEKRALRSVMRRRFRELPQQDKFLLDMAMHRNLAMHPWLLEADTVLAFCSTRHEPDTRWLIGWLLGTGRQCALPVCSGEGQMQFYLLRAQSELVSGAYGIQEPSGREAPVLTGRSLCIVPGLAFTEDGTRLGQGGGYYDRFLAAHPQLRTIGITYRMMVQETIPAEEHDCRVGAVVTD